jgi:hypothetical protein
MQPRKRRAQHAIATVLHWGEHSEHDLELRSPDLILACKQNTDAGGAGTRAEKSNRPHHQGRHEGLAQQEVMPIERALAHSIVWLRSGEANDTLWRGVPYTSTRQLSQLVRISCAMCRTGLGLLQVKGVSST